MEITVPAYDYYLADSDDDASSTSTETASPPAAFGAPRVSLSDDLPEWQCKYTGKICPHPRARKTNGKLHRMCQQHRVRANDNQRRLQRKRREARATAPYPVSPPAAEQQQPLVDGWEDWVVEILKEDTEVLEEPLAAATAEPLAAPCELTDEDVEELTQLFTSSISTESTNQEIYDVMCGAIFPEAT